jgi:hypothetical protein
MFLDPEELRKLTGYTSPAWQRRWLDRQGFIYTTAADGKVSISKAYVESRMSGFTPKAQLNFDALKRRV